MTRHSTIIIGAGQGGLQAGISLRQEGFDGTITLIGTEPGLPYQRPPLSKAYLINGDADALTLRPQSFFESKDITYLPETTVTLINRAEQQVTVHGPEGEADIHYDHLILAMGTRNVCPPIEGAELAYGLRTLRDAGSLRKLLSDRRRIAVIGGGFIGLEFAAVARKQNHEVAVIEASPRLMSRVISPLMSEYFAGLHREWGTELHLGQAATAIEGDGVSMADGSTISAELVLIAAGVRPNVELAVEAGLTVEDGVRVDANLVTSDPAIFALGDCANFPDPRTGRHIRLESVQAATDHARLIAARIAKNADNPYAAVPWFWSDQGDRKLQIAGFAGLDTREEVLEDGVVARLEGDTVAAVESVNKAGIHMKTRRLLAGHTPISLNALKQTLSSTG